MISGCCFEDGFCSGSGVAQAQIQTGSFVFPYEPKLIISGDFNLFNSGYNQCGVYMCSGLFESESFSTPLYIGSAGDFYKRFQDHFKRLKAGDHENPVFQNAWNKYGKENFVWFELEGTTSDAQFPREQWYFDNFRPFVDEGRGFNIAKYAANGMKGRKHTEESKRKMRESRGEGENHPLFGRKHTEESKKRMSAVRKGKVSEENKKSGIERLVKYLKSDLAKQRTVERCQRYFRFKNPQGELVEGYNLKKFCRENKLYSQHLNKVKRGEWKQYKGWTKAD